MKEKKIPVFTIILLSIVLLLVFFEVKSWLLGEKMDIITRAMFSDKAYAKKIEIKAYILTDDQLKDLFDDPNEEPHQLTQKQLIPYNINLVLRMKSLTGAAACGTLLYSFGNDKWWRLDIPEVGRKDEINHFVVPMDSMGVAKTSSDSLPEIKVKWKTLYTKY